MVPMIPNDSLGVLYGKENVVAFLGPQKLYMKLFMKVLEENSIRKKSQALSSRTPFPWQDPLARTCGRVSVLTVLRAVGVLRRVFLAVLVRQPLLVLRLQAAHGTTARGQFRG